MTPEEAERANQAAHRAAKRLTKAARRRPYVVVTAEACEAGGFVVAVRWLGCDRESTQQLLKEAHRIVMAQAGQEGEPAGEDR